MSQSTVITTDHIMEIAMTPIELQEVLAQVQSQGAGAKLVEWGSGGSTIFWLANFNSHQELVSIENHRVWQERVQKAIDQIPVTAKFTYVSYDTPDQDGATFAPEHDQYKDYVQGPDGIWDADVYLVDGRVRLWCARNIFEKATNRDAVVYCHDYATNEGWYDQLLVIYPKHQVIHTAGTDYKMLKLWLR